jgi:alkanesulfonate monooxygenase SsuD/methylene tetrahydromethanopterin reductase-like flavin-dependent oxidoreductase (luciferase family)
MSAVGALYAGGRLGLKPFATAVEAAGLSSIWCGDHVAGQVDGIAALGVLAGATESITIGSCVIVAPFRPAVVTAKGLMTAAHAAPGRMIVGLGAGGDLPAEFAAVGADLHTRGAQLDECIEVIRRLWSGAPADFDGQWTTLTRMQLHPIVQPPPPIWIGGRSAAAVRRAARIGAGYLPYLVSPSEVRRRVGSLEVAASEAGESWQGQVGAVTYVVSGRNRAAALSRTAEAVPVRGLSTAQLGSRCLVGDTDDIIEQARAYVTAGVDHLILGCPADAGADVDEFLTIARSIADELDGDHR